MNIITDQTARATRITLRLLPELFSGDGSHKVSIRLWDGTLWPDEAPRPVTFVLKHPASLRAMFLPGTELGLAEAYLYDDFDIEGEIASIFGLVESLVQQTTGWRKKLDIGRDLLRLPAGTGKHVSRRGPAKLSGKQHSIPRDRLAVTYHYDVSNDFYALWLDKQMVYSCAYFKSTDDSLDAAQERKLDYICRKLRLKPGQRLLDIGCGWGGLVMYAVKHYGVDATGITLSRPQADFANRHIQETGQADHCRVLVNDYREMDAPPFDALVSVGMFEHVGKALLPTYFEEALNLMKPGGVFLNHGITSRALDDATRSSFYNAYVFPDSELLPIHTALRAAEEAGFEVRDVESLREHYAMTLRHWVRRLEQQHAAALKYVDELTYRVWRLYMSSSIYAFETRKTNIYQCLLVKPDEMGHSGLPLTRMDWYR